MRKLDTTLLALVPHRQVVLTIPKRLRAYCLDRRRLLGEIARVAARTVTAAIRTLTGERELAVGIVACLQAHGSRSNWHPHLHLLETDGGVRPNESFVAWPVHDTARLTEAFRRAVLRLFVRLALIDEEQAAGMRTWPHSGFHVHTAVWVSEDDRTCATRLARSCARNPVALEQLTDDRSAKAVTYRSDTSDGPTAGTEAVDPLECLARVLVHIPDTGHVSTRYDGWYANRARGMRGTAESTAVPPTIVPTPRLAPSEATRRWAALLQQIVEVDPLACPTCRGVMRIIAIITQASVIDEILAHRRTRAATAAHAAAARSPPSTRDRLDPSPRDDPTRPIGPAESRLDVPAHVRGRSACASVPPRRPIGPRGGRMPMGHAVRTATEARGRAAGRPLRAGRPSRGRRSRRMLAEYSTEPD